MQARREAGADPEGIGHFDKHAIRTDVARVAAENGGAPFDLEASTKLVARRPAAFEAPGWLIPTAHNLGMPPCQGKRTAAPERDRRPNGTRIRERNAQGYDAGSGCFVPANRIQSDKSFEPGIAAGSDCAKTFLSPAIVKRFPNALTGFWTQKSPWGKRLR